MKLNPQEIQARFRRHAVRVTRQRAAIYAALAETTSHPTADDLYRQVKRQQPMMSRNTIYYTLGVLRKAGLVQEVNVGHQVARFDGNVTMHHHLICLGCGQIMDLTDERLNRLDISDRPERGFHVLGHRVEFHGYCSRCYQARHDASRVNDKGVN